MYNPHAISAAWSMQVHVEIADHGRLERAGAAGHAAFDRTQEE
jgi:hypothetical protein